MNCPNKPAESGLGICTRCWGLIEPKLQLAAFAAFQQHGVGSAELGRALDTCAEQARESIPPKKGKGRNADA